MMKKEDILKFYKDYKLFIFPSVVALSSLTLIIFVIYPQVTKLISNQKIEEELFNKSGLLITKAEALEGFDEQDLSTKVNYALNSYPSEKDFGNTLGLLQTISSQSGFSVGSLALAGNSTAKGNTQSYSLKMELTGSKNLLPVLIGNIEGSNRLMKVTTIEVSSRDSGVVVALGIDVLYSPIPDVFGSIDSPLPELSQTDEQLLVKLATVAPQSTSAIISSGPRGKENPFE